MEEAGIPGLSAAWVEGGQVAWTGAFGVRDATTGTPVTDETVFEAASLSKPVVAYVAMRLVARGELDLDIPLWDDVGYERLAHDDRARGITPRMILTHTSGLPNWGGTPLELNRDPGSGWNYSGEGFVYLATLLERRTGLGLNELARREVFDPLGMAHSSFVWRSDYDTLAATPHDLLGRAGRKNRPTSANAAASLHTTAADYARFLVAVMGGEGLPDAVAEEMLTAQADIGGWGSRETWEYLSWGLGWGLQRGERAPAIWHWGDNGDFRCFVVAYPELGDGLVYFTNSNSGLAVAEAVTDLAFDDTQWSVRYLDYQSYDQPRRRARIALRRSFIEEGGEEGAWELLERLSSEFPADVAESEALGLAGFLGQEGRAELGVSVLRWGAERFGSAAFHQALGEAFTEQGEYARAAESYRTAVELQWDLAEDLEPRLAWLRQGLDAEGSPYRPDPESLSDYVGVYGPRTIVLTADGLRYSREGASSETLLLPLARDLFGLEGIPTFRLRFERDEEGRVVRIVGLYSDGRTDRSERSG
jgi:CubicO group peptidase (beta-lactamase class C family)